MVKKRVTITLDKEFDEKIRQLQVDYIIKSNKSWSYSSVLSMVIGEGLKALSHKTRGTKDEKPSKKPGN